MLKALAMAATLAWPMAASAAATVTSVFSPVGAHKWSVDITVANDSLAAPISQFTVYFSELRYSNLALSSAPASWDMMVIDADLGIPAAGFVDGVVLDGLDALGDGEFVSGIRLTFDVIGSGMPAALPFEVYDAGFTLLDAGTTRASINDPGHAGVPEPSSVGLMMLALASCSLAAGRRRAADAG
jgi:hypothetical protein